MGDYNWQEALATLQADGTAVTGTVEATLLNAQAKATIAANRLANVGNQFRVRATGRISNIVTTPGTLTLKLKFGAIAVATSSAIQLNALAKTNVAWFLDWGFTVRAIGSGTAANIMHNGSWQSESVVGSAVPASGGAGSAMMQASAPAVGTGFDSTIANQIDLTATFSLTGNSIQAHTYAFEMINC